MFLKASQACSAAARRQVRAENAAERGALRGSEPRRASFEKLFAGQKAAALQVDFGRSALRRSASDEFSAPTSVPCGIETTAPADCTSEGSAEERQRQDRAAWTGVSALRSYASVR